ncbi:hypothetical protein VMCG_05084 [Cytospora schulzeri]|uniref:BTB domain-containing protein n=1 Tax=Cytospora schulzeri TaxID=448051 RepID=A0A423WMW5_9PEZI|nr:hypothetical protein VMCG_05084 [Valsa malicola]
MADFQNIQQTGVASSSDTDSVVSLAARTNNMSLNGSSSPVESASSGSDMNDVTIMKFPEAIVDEDEKPMAFYDKNGNLCDENTPFGDFKNWQDYLSFCNQGPQLKVRTAVHDGNGDVIRYRREPYPKKLLCDFGEYFCGMYRVKMIESTTGVVNLDDIDFHDFDRLMRVIEAGGPGAKPNLGPLYHTMGIYLEVYILADRFMMPMIKAWATVAMEDHMRGRLDWAQVYQKEVLEHPNAIAAAATHQEMLLDFNDCWVRSEFLPDDNRPVQQARIVQFILNYCPRVLLHDTIHQLHPELVRDICAALLAV